MVKTLRDKQLQNNKRMPLTARSLYNMTARFSIEEWCDLIKSCYHITGKTRAVAWKITHELPKCSTPEVSVFEISILRLSSSIASDMSVSSVANVPEKRSIFLGKYIAEELLSRIATFALPFRRKIIIFLLSDWIYPDAKMFPFPPTFLFQDKSNIFATQHNSQNLLFLLLNKRFNYPSLRCPFLLIPALLISPKPPYTKCYWKPDWSAVVQINYNYNLKPNKLNSFNAK